MVVERPIHPRIWLLTTGEKTGDNAQTELIASSLGEPYVTKKLVYKKNYPKPCTIFHRHSHKKKKLFFRPSIQHVDRQLSDPLQTPWPRLVITVGRKAGMVALWIYRQSKGYSRIVLIGRPRQRWFIDKRHIRMIHSADFEGTPSRHILPIDFPLLNTNPPAIATAGTAWQSRFATRSRPMTAVFIGGQSGPFRFDREVAMDLIQRLKPIAAEGSLYVTTSRRTSPVISATLQQHLPPNHTFFCWSPNSQDNPYQALLALADRFVVTGDSISMMIEVAQLGKPLAIFELPYRMSERRIWRKITIREGQGPWPQRLRWLKKTFQWLGLTGYTRHLANIHRLLYQQGLAVPLGQAFLPNEGRKIRSELPRVITHIKQLMDN